MTQVFFYYLTGSALNQSLYRLFGTAVSSKGFSALVSVIHFEAAQRAGILNEKNKSGFHKCIYSFFVELGNKALKKHSAFNGGNESVLTLMELFRKFERQAKQHSPIRIIAHKLQQQHISETVLFLAGMMTRGKLAIWKSPTLFIAGTATVNPQSLPLVKSETILKDWISGHTFSDFFQETVSTLRFIDWFKMNISQAMNSHLRREEREFYYSDLDTDLYARFVFARPSETDQRQLNQYFIHANAYSVLLPSVFNHCCRPNQRTKRL